MTTVATRVLLVTGGSRGIGAACCRRAASQGWDVAVNYTRDAAAAERVAADVRARGRRAITVAADVADEAQVLAMYRRIDAELGPLDGLVNNAGVVDQPQRVQDMGVARLRRMFDTNILGSFLCAREAIRRMQGRGGAIVNLSSAAAVMGAPAFGVEYAASKSAIDLLTIGLGREVAAEGIRVNAVRPGLIETEIHASGGLPDRVRDLQHLVPMQRGGTADEVAQAIVWLLSDAASYTTMSLLDVSGGR
jgi:NAD(P)-dependent dehydrogenase (short-subunit alcohol dehydrogenase family)